MSKINSSSGKKQVEQKSDRILKANSNLSCRRIGQFPLSKTIQRRCCDFGILSKFFGEGGQAMTVFVRSGHVSLVKINDKLIEQSVVDRFPPNPLDAALNRTE